MNTANINYTHPLTPNCEIWTNIVMHVCKGGLICRVRKMPHKSIWFSDFRLFQESFALETQLYLKIRSSLNSLVNLSCLESFLRNLDNLECFNHIQIYDWPRVSDPFNFWRKVLPCCGETLKNGYKDPPRSAFWRCPNNMGELSIKS